MTAPRMEKLRQFIQDLDALHREFADETALLDAVALRLAALVKKDDWLPEEYTLPHPHHYQQYLLHVDSGQRFSIVSFVWGPGQSTPIHDHRVWGAIGMLRGAEENQRYRLDERGLPVISGVAERLSPGEVEKVSGEQRPDGPGLDQYPRLRRQYRRRQARGIYPGRPRQTFCLRLLQPPLTQYLGSLKG